MNKAIFLLVLILFLPLTALASNTDGTLSGYAWSSNAGWFHFGTANGNARIDDTHVFGYAWNDNYGWLNLNPTNSGVKNDANGNLSGRAWLEGTGWINFSGVTVSSAGAFSGTATGDNSINITFDCTNCNVTTDWRPRNSRVASGGLVYIKSPTPPSPPPLPSPSPPTGYNPAQPLPPLTPSPSPSPPTPTPTPTPIPTPTPTPTPIPSSVPPVSPPASGQLIPAIITFTKNFYMLYESDPQVKNLQQFLNVNGFTVAESGVGSAGNETTIFGPLTKLALAKFQNAYAKQILEPIGLAVGTGWFGPSTREFINSLFGAEMPEELKLPKQPEPPSQSPPVAGQLVGATVVFTKNFYTLYQSDIQVKALQQFLNVNGFIVAESGVGSAGNETTIFGPLTKAALTDFQNIYKKEILTPVGLTQGTGLFGPSTRSFINSIK